LNLKLFHIFQLLSISMFVVFQLHWHVT